MTDILPFLKSLISVSGLSGYEGPIAELITEKWRPLVDEISLSRVGSLHGLKQGTGKSPRPSLMIATHMDAIGMRVSKIVDGFLHLIKVGEIDVRVLPGAEVMVHASRSNDELPGVIALPPARFLPESVGDKILIERSIPDSCRATWRRKSALEIWSLLPTSRWNWREMCSLVTRWITAPRLPR